MGERGEHRAGERRDQSGDGHHDVPGRARELLVGEEDPEDHADRQEPDEPREALDGSAAVRERELAALLQRGGRREPTAERGASRAAMKGRISQPRQGSAKCLTAPYLTVSLTA